MVGISVIVPTFKRITQTIKTISLLLSCERFNQSFQAEIIVADSTPDNSLEVALRNKFGNKIIYTRPDKPGVAANKNKGAKIASNPILVFCDSDMEMEKDTLVKTFSTLKKYSTAAGLGGQVIWRSGRQDGQTDRPREEDRRQEINGTTYIEALYSRYFVTYKKVFWDIGGYDDKVFNMRGEGSDLSIRYWRAGYPLVYDQNIVVHHVHNSPDSIALRIDHPEWGIAKDLLLLAYKYDIMDDSNKNFIHTVAANFKIFGEEGFYRIIQGIVKHYDFIYDVKKYLDDEKKRMKPEYDFKFLEIFSRKGLFNLCVREAENRLLKIRKQSFYE